MIAHLGEPADQHPAGPIPAEVLRNPPFNDRGQRWPTARPEAVAGVLSGRAGPTHARMRTAQGGSDAPGNATSARRGRRRATRLAAEQLPPVWPDRLGTIKSAGLDRRAGRPVCLALGMGRVGIRPTEGQRLANRAGSRSGDRIEGEGRSHHQSQVGPKICSALGGRGLASPILVGHHVVALRC